MVIFDKRKDKGAGGRAGKDGAVTCRTSAATAAEKSAMGGRELRVEPFIGSTPDTPSVLIPSHRP